MRRVGTRGDNCREDELSDGPPGPDSSHQPLAPSFVVRRARPVACTYRAPRRMRSSVHRIRSREQPPSGEEESCFEEERPILSTTCRVVRLLSWRRRCGDSQEEETTRCG